MSTPARIGETGSANPTTSESPVLTDTDLTLLKARLVEYRATPPNEKNTFRVACAKYIIRSRNRDDTDPYLLELFSGVRSL